MTRPLVGLSKPERILISVDLPAPLRPRIATRSPIDTRNEMPSRTRRLPFSVSKSLTISMASIRRAGEAFAGGSISMRRVTFIQAPA
jgi:hypothetical protein